MNDEAPLHIPRAVADRILDYARRSFDVEVCGLLGRGSGGQTSWYPVANIADDPLRRFHMDPGQQIAAMKSMRKRGEELLAVVHSHPYGPALPSAIDVEEMGYPEAYCMIVSLQDRRKPELRCFRLAAEEIREIALACEPGT